MQIKLLQAKLDLCVQNVKLTKSTLKAKDDLAGFSPGNRCRVLQSCNINCHEISPGISCTPLILYSFSQFSPIWNKV